MTDDRKAINGSPTIDDGTNGTNILGEVTVALLIAAFAVVVFWLHWDPSHSNYPTYLQTSLIQVVLLMMALMFIYMMAESKTASSASTRAGLAKTTKLLIISLMLMAIASYALLFERMFFAYFEYDLLGLIFVFCETFLLVAAISSSLICYRGFEKA